MDIWKIDAKRKEQRWTVTAFCEKLGIDRKTYYNFLKNPDSMKVSTFRQIAQILNMSAAEQREVLK